MRQQLRSGEALRENTVTAVDDGLTNDVRICMNELEESAVDKAEIEDLAWLEIREDVEEELSGEFVQVDNGVTLLVACHFFPLHALRALVVQSECCRLVLERLFIVTDMSWHSLPLSLFWRYPPPRFHHHGDKRIGSESLPFLLRGFADWLLHEQLLTNASMASLTACNHF